MRIGTTITIGAAIIVATFPAIADAKKGGQSPVACSIAQLGQDCVPARCPEQSNGRPCKPRPCTLKKRFCGQRPVRLLKLSKCDGTRHAIGQLIVRDENRDGIVEYTYGWSGVGVGEGEQSATWDGERAVPDGPIPVIAAMAEYGWRVTDSHSDANVDRMVCSPPTKQARIEKDVPKRLRAEDRYSVTEHDAATTWWVAQLPPATPTTTSTPGNSDPDADKVNPAGTVVIG